MDSPYTRQGPLGSLVIGTIAISFSPVFIRLAEVSPDSAGFYRMLFAAVSLALLLKIRRVKIRIGPAPLGLLIASGVVLSLDFMCWHRSIHFIGPGLSTLLGNFQVFFTVLLSRLLFRERPGRLFLLAVILASVGMVLVTGTDLGARDADYRFGVLFGFGTALCYSGYILLMKSAMNRQPLDGSTCMLVVSLTCTLFFAVVTPAMGASFRIPDLVSLLALLGVGVVCTTFGWSLISSALKVVPVTLASLFLLLQPGLAFVWDVLFFARPTSGIEALGVLLILAGIYFGMRKSPR